ncbi:MAG: hypothetical protein COB60_04910 [Flavobacteriaceae bacterium]|nr:MAG: hypothetical protein COB60_04910 [Flavobacteriaceae bacterium]
MKFKLTCDEATAICTKNQYGEASFGDKFRMLFHVIFCSVCRLYSKQNTVISKCVSNIKVDVRRCRELDPVEKEEMEIKIKEYVE